MDLLMNAKKEMNLNTNKIQPIFFSVIMIFTQQYISKISSSY